MTAGCASCGDCCERVMISSPIGTITAKAAGTGRWASSGRYLRDAAFILKWMRPTGEVERFGDQVRQVWTRDAFDPVERRCTQHADRPQMCSGYPWYGQDPRPNLREKHCSYWADVPAASRPEGVRPLIPLAVI